MKFQFKTSKHGGVRNNYFLVITIMNVFLRSQFATKKNNYIETRGGKYKNPRVFTEQGVAMLATILKSDVATKVSIAIMDAFVIMRKYISNELIGQKYINNLVIKHDEDIKLLKDSFNKFEEKKKDNEIILTDKYMMLIQK